jgi:acyl dehydratase
MAAAYEIGKPYFVTARIAYHDSNNRMHSDGLPQKLGFRGPLVLGLATYGNMTRALAATFGEAWLGHAVMDVKFLSVVCEGDKLRVETSPIEGREGEKAYKVTAYNESNEGKAAAYMETSMPAILPPIEPHAAREPNEWEGPVKERRSWDVIVVDKAYRSLRSTLSVDDNAHWGKVLGDDLPIYYEGKAPAIHPTHVLRQVQIASTNQYIGDNAVHGSTKAVVRRMLRVGDPIQVLTVPTAKWERKGNHWVTLYCAIRSGGEVCAEMFHTQIFKLRGTEEPAKSGAQV